MKKTAILIISVVIFTLAGCGSTSQMQSNSGVVKSFQTVLVPELGIENTVYLGDRMMFSGNGWYVDCLVPMFEYTDTRNLGMATVTVKKGVPMCASGEDANTFKPDYVNWTPNFKYPVKIEEKENGEVEFCFFVGIACPELVTVSKGQYKIETQFKSVENDFQQTIEYAGKSGDILQFTYSEFKDGMARDAFTREFQIDLSESNVMAYKGAIVEINKATNSEITYTVKRYFQ
jgi:uncharacterized lipoprotein NlpE involved in copper resistance